jgi:hypothetical protein
MGAKHPMNHIKTLKLLNLVFAAFFGLLSLPSLIFILTGAVALPGQPKEGLMFVLFGLVFFGLLIGIAIAHAYAAFMITAGRARHLQTVLATLHLSNLPIGTAYAAYALWVCHVNDASRAVFASPFGRRVH